MGTVLVTGGLGFIGRRVVPLLASEGWDVTVLHRPDRDGRPGDADARTLAVDLHDARRLDEVMAGADLVVHLAARSGGIQFQEAFEADVFFDNQRITRNLLESARRAGVRRVFVASSAVVYAGEGDRELTEDSPCVTPFRDRVSGYAWSKLTDETLAAWFAAVGAFEVVVGRFTSLYGPGGSFDPARSTVVHALVRKAVEAGPGGTLQVWGKGDAVRSFLHVEDAARAVADILLRGRDGEAYNVDSSEPVTIRRLAELVRDAVDPTVTLTFDDRRPEGTPHRVLDTTRLRTLGFTPRIALAAGIAATAADYRLTTLRSGEATKYQSSKP